jgi:NodT family efflux transporter outer membrane factor (OMF) lipoprotein
MKQNKIFYALAVSLFALGGCDYYRKADAKPPLVNLGQSGQSLPNLVMQSIVFSTWWNDLGDNQLSALIETGLKQNNDLALAQARLKEVRALLDINNYALGPAGSVGTGISATRLSEKGQLPLDKIPSLQRDMVLTKYGYDASWEIDVFGGLRNAIDAANAKMLMAQYEYNGVRILIGAEIARAYYENMGARRELLIANQYLSNLNQIIELIRLNVKAGNLSSRELEEIIAKRNQYQTQIPAINAKIKASEIAITTLIGKLPEEVLNSKLSQINEPKLFAFPIGARSELLKRRPDILAAEAKLQMRASEIQYYEAEHFPKFKIGAHAGWEARDPSDLFKTTSQVLAIAPSIEWKIFDGGRIDANVNSAKAREDQAIIEYKKTIINAIGDTERALSDYNHAIETNKIRANSSAELNSILNHQNNRFKHGDISKIELLEAQNALLDNKMWQIKSQTQAGISMIALLKSLGGGWSQGDIILK